ncbi:MAG: hypothetical protein Q9195_007091 [Heterodermia aff. obscurata]
MARTTLILRRLKSTTASISTKLIAEELLAHAHNVGPITQRQLIDANQLQRLSLTLNRPNLHADQSIRLEAPSAGTPVPPGYHLAYFTPAALSNELGQDGTDRIYNPKAPYTRRMWAGGDISWDIKNQLSVGQEVTETTRLLSADAKVTRTGEEMIVVGVQKTFKNRNGVALVDRRDWVFRKALLEPVPVQRIELPNLIPLPDPTDSHFLSRDFLQTPVTLFRFSALTFNGHQIHYSQPWCREVEGHRDIVVHGPLNLINMLDLWRDAQPDGALKVPRSIRYRATAPIYVNEQYRGVLERRDAGASNIKLWGSDGQGGVRVGMAADIEAF